MLRNIPHPALHRIEALVDKDFYSNYGKNIAVVSEDLIRECQDVALVKNFLQPCTLTDKHGISYRCHVAQQKEQDVTLKDFADAMFSFFRNTSDNKNKVIEKNLEASNDERRVYEREKTYSGEGMFVELRCQGLQWPGIIYDFGTRGIGVVLEEEGGINDYVDNVVEVSFDLHDQTFISRARVLRIERKCIHGKEKPFLALSMLSPERTSTERSHQRYDLKGVKHKPTVVVKSPYSLNKTYDLEVTSLSFGGFGCQSIENFSMIPGMVVKAELFFPLSGNLACNVRVCHAGNLADKGEIIGFEIVGDKSASQKVSAEYLLKVLPERVHPSELRRNGFLGFDPSDSIQIRYAEGAQDMKDIAALRLKVWQEFGMFEDVTETEKMIDRYDAFSRHIMIFHGNKLISAARIVFNSGEREKIEQLSYGAEIPDDLLKKKFVEFGRAILLSDYRGGEIWCAMLYHLARVALESGHTHVVISCNEITYKKIYKHYGFKILSDFQNDGQLWHLCSVNMKSIVDNRSIVPVGWLMGYEDVHKYFEKRGLVEKSLLGIVNRSVIESIKPFTQKKIYKNLKKSS